MDLRSRNPARLGLCLSTGVLALAVALVAVALRTSPHRIPVRSHEPASAVDVSTRWRPSVGLSWQWQLDGQVRTDVNSDVFDIDGFDTPKATVDELHRQGKRAICYLDLGAVETGRPDSSDFPRAVVGRPVDGWPGERYLDIRRIDVLGPIIAKRLSMCRSKGFDGVEADLLDAYANESGFPIRVDDELRFIRWFVGQAHARGLAAGLKNDPDLVVDLANEVDFAVVEDCFSERTCSQFAPLVALGKPVFDAEYHAGPGEFCHSTQALGISAIAKPLSLDARRVACPGR